MKYFTYIILHQNLTLFSQKKSVWVILIREIIIMFICNTYLDISSFCFHWMVLGIKNVGSYILYIGKPQANSDRHSSQCHLTLKPWVAMNGSSTKKIVKFTNVHTIAQDNPWYFILGHTSTVNPTRVLDCIFFLPQHSPLYGKNIQCGGGVPGYDFCME